MNFTTFCEYAEQVSKTTAVELALANGVCRAQVELWAMRVGK